MPSCSPDFRRRSRPSRDCGFDSLPHLLEPPGLVELLEQGGLGMEQMHEFRQLLWIAAVLQQKPDRVIADFAIVHYGAGDSWAVGGFKRRGGIEGERDEIAVARIAMPQQGAQFWQRLVLIAASQEQLG